MFDSSKKLKLEGHSGNFVNPYQREEKLVFENLSLYRRERMQRAHPHNDVGISHEPTEPGVEPVLEDIFSP